MVFFVPVFLAIVFFTNFSIKLNGKTIKFMSLTYIWSQRKSIKEKYKTNPSTAKESQRSKGP